MGSVRNSSRTPDLRQRKANDSIHTCPSLDDLPFSLYSSMYARESSYKRLKGNI
jgi:hypothetical protein